ncbi:hypothetical protein Hdeb2414_s0034g00726351 [Helianthus debilis subsp. tardiflorus]
MGINRRRFLPLLYFFKFLKFGFLHLFHFLLSLLEYLFNPSLSSSCLVQILLRRRESIKGGLLLVPTRHSLDGKRKNSIILFKGWLFAPSGEPSIPLLVPLPWMLLQINAIGLPRITHFEYVCRAYRIEPMFEMFNVFYSVTYTSGFYSFQARTGVAPVCSVPLKSLHN